MDFEIIQKDDDLAKIFQKEEKKQDLKYDQQSSEPININFNDFLS